MEKGTVKKFESYWALKVDKTLLGKSTGVLQADVLVLNSLVKKLNTRISQDKSKLDEVLKQRRAFLVEVKRRHNEIEQIPLRKKGTKRAKGEGVKTKVIRCGISREKFNKLSKAEKECLIKLGLV